MTQRYLTQLQELFFSTFFFLCLSWRSSDLRNVKTMWFRDLRVCYISVGLHESQFKVRLWSSQQAQENKDACLIKKKKRLVLLFRSRRCDCFIHAGKWENCKWSLNHHINHPQIFITSQSHTLCSSLPESVSWLWFHFVCLLIWLTLEVVNFWLLKKDHFQTSDILL